MIEPVSACVALDDLPAVRWFSACLTGMQMIHRRCCFWQIKKQQREEDEAKEFARQQVGKQTTDRSAVVCRTQHGFPFGWFWVGHVGGATFPPQRQVQFVPYRTHKSWMYVCMYLCMYVRIWWAPPS